MWPDLIKKAKEGGLNVIQTYIFWNLHEPIEGQVLFLASPRFVPILPLCFSNQKAVIIEPMWMPYVCMQFNVEGNYDFVKFIKLIGENGMYVTLRVGPFIEAEWNHGYNAIPLPLFIFPV